MTHRIDQLSGELRALQAVTRDDSPLVVSGIDELPPTNLIQSPTFRFPDVVKGYLAANLGTLASSRCPRGPFQPRGEIPIRIRLKNPTIRDRLTPLIVSIVRRDSERSVTQFWEAQFEVRADNLVLAPAPETAGAYELTAGFYLYAEMNTAFPPFYRMTCEIRVTA